MFDLSNLNKLIFDCSINLEQAELRKQKVKNFIDRIFNDDSLQVIDRIRILKEAWVIYKDYDDNILPFALNNLREANKILQNLKK